MGPAACRGCSCNQNACCGFLFEKLKRAASHSTCPHSSLSESMLILSTSFFPFFKFDFIFLILAKIRGKPRSRFFNPLSAARLYSFSVPRKLGVPKNQRKKTDCKPAPLFQLNPWILITAPPIIIMAYVLTCIFSPFFLLGKTQELNFG